MKKNNKIASYLGLAFRARKLKTGSDVALSEIRKKSAKLVLLSSLASSNTKKMFQNKTLFYKIDFYIIDDEIIKSALPIKKIKVITIIDEGFASSIVKILKGS